jgi:hypothetical protein
MRTTSRLAVVLSAVLLGASACTSSDTPEAGTSTSPMASPTAASTQASGTASTMPSSGADATPPDEVRTRPAVAAAIADTATREDVAPEEVVIAALSPVTWDDGSIGCPQKGKVYTQALVDGDLLLLRVGTGLFQYHSSEGGPFAYCANPSSAYSVTADE